MDHQAVLHALDLPLRLFMLSPLLALLLWAARWHYLHALPRLARSRRLTTPARSVSRRISSVGRRASSPRSLHRRRRRRRVECDAAPGPAGIAPVTRSPSTAVPGGAG